MRKSELLEKIAPIIRKEIRESLPGILREVLSEMYLRQMVSEQVSRPAPVASRPTLVDALGMRKPESKSDPVLRETLRRKIVEDDEQRLPDFGNPLLSEDNSMRSIYQDISIVDDEMDPEDADLRKLGLDLSVTKKISEGIENRVNASRTDNMASAERSRRIADSVKVNR